MSAECEINQCWNALQSFPFGHLRRPFAINSDEFVVAAPKTNFLKGDGIYKFNTNKNKWIKIFNYDDNFKYDIWSSAYDIKNKSLYVSVCDTSTWPSKMLIFDLNTTNNVISISNPQNERYFRLVFVDNTLHQICNVSGNHFIYDKTKQFKKINSFESFQNLHRYGLIKLKSTKSMFVFGGKNYSSLPSKLSNAIYEFSFTNSKWNQLNIKMPKQLSQFGIVKTSNEQYIIILGGWSNGYERSDNIFIYNTRNNTFIKSKIKCPEKARCHAIIMNNSKRDEMATYGFVNDSYKLENFIHMQLLPQYLINIIGCYYCNEKLHLLQKDTGKHWKINVDYILQ